MVGIPKDAEIWPKPLSAANAKLHKFNNAIDSLSVKTPQIDFIETLLQD